MPGIFIGNRIGRRSDISFSSYWTTLISATVEDAAQTSLVLTFPIARTSVGATDLTVTINGWSVAVNSASWTGAVLTAVLASAVKYGDVVVVTFVPSGGTTTATNNVTYITTQKTLWGANLIRYYPMQEASGTVADDVSANNSDGTYSGPVVNQAGIDANQKSVLFDDLTDYCDMYSADLNTKFNRSEGTIIIWFKVATAFWTDGVAHYWMRFYINDNNEILIQKFSGTNKKIFAYIKGNGTSKAVETSSYMITSGWNQLALTWSVSGDLAKMYLNGIKTSDGASGIVALIGNLSANYCLIANYTKTSSVSIFGNLCHTIILDRAASEAEILNSFYKKAFVVFEGDSRMLPEKAVDQYSTDAIANKYYAKYNNSVTGSSIAVMDARGAAVDAMLKTGTENVLVVWIGVNNSSQSAATMYAAISSYCTARKAAGYKVVICTEIDGQSVGLIANDWPNKYLALNTLIRNNHSFADAVADLGAETELQDATNVTYFSADKIHLIEAGSAVVGGVIGAAINSIT